MMKKFLVLTLFAVSATSTFAVDITLTLTAGEANRFAAACGEIKQLRDAQVPPQPRPCNVAESKQMVIERLKQIIIDVEGSKLTKQAVDAVVIPVFDPK